MFKIKKIHTLLQHLETGLLTTLLLSTILIAVGQIILRNLFDYGLFWAESYIRISVLWVVLLGAMIASRNNEHIAIDFFVLKMRTTTRILVKRFTDFFSASLCFLMAYHSAIFIHSEYQEANLAFGSVPTWLCESIIPVTFIIIAVRYAIAAIFNIQQVKP
jgi:C4-dicarboxylate transporter, DctQ subunit